jgi:hypothetical protein
MMKTTIAFALMLALTAVAGQARAYTEQERQACEPEAFRLCSDAIPDEARVKACLIANMRKLTPACRRVFTRSRPRGFRS